MKLLRAATLLFVAFFISACGYGTPDQFASQNAIKKYAYVSNEAPSLTLLTMVNNRTGRGGHSSLLINGSQVVLYDPAGRWKNPKAPERHDVVYGLTPQLQQRYKSFHARSTHHVVSEKIPVSLAVANQAIAASIVQGRAKDATCSINTTAVLNQLPGFEGVKSTYFPEKLMKRFAELDGVVTTSYYENDVGKN